MFANVFASSGPSGKLVRQISLIASDQDRDLAFSFEATTIAHPVNPNAELQALAINEVSRINAVQTSIELFNFGETPIDLSKYQIQTGNQFQSITGIIDANEAKTIDIATGGSNDSLSQSLTKSSRQSSMPYIHVKSLWHDHQTEREIGFASPASRLAK